MGLRGHLSVPFSTALLLVALGPSVPSIAQPEYRIAAAVGPGDGYIGFGLQKGRTTYLMVVDQNGQTRSLAGGGITGFVWSPHGSRIVFSRVEGARADSPANQMTEILRNEHAYAAMMLDQPFSGPSLVQRPPQIPFLVPYRTYGVGVSWENGGPVATVVLVHADPAAALTNAARLRNVFDHGTVGPGLGAPPGPDGPAWSAVASSIDISVDANVVIAHLRSTQPDLWYLVALNQYDLLQAAGR